MGQMVCRELTVRMVCQVLTERMVHREFKVWQDQMDQMGYQVLMEQTACREQTVQMVCRVQMAHREFKV